MATLLSDPGSALVALDFDGTLAPIVARPEDSAIATGGLEVLQRLAAAIGRLAIVTGRAADVVVRLGHLDEVAGIRVLGHYGLQSWQDGRLTTPPPDPGVELARQRLPGLLATAPDGVFVEDKHHSVVVHTRPAAQPQPALDALTPALLGLAAEAGLEAVPGRYVVELRPPGIDKGLALRSLATELDATSVIYVGDDVGDLPAFRAVAELRATGIAGLSVVAVSGADEVPPALRAAADLELTGPDAVVAWLGGIADQLAG